ncbi:glutaminase A [Leucobacter weissii]|uniref:Glutaminase n=1 Tax=Leucobacter weissii TaxID=1983706 RepID=A0A939SAS6_9MICO|nr:glutaminase A [Leucobacter weissii]MBO1900703.1 glutaminase A [Leucobacter weissii]
MQSPILEYLRRVHADLARLEEGAPYSAGRTDALAAPDDTDAAGDFGIALATVDGYVYEVGATAKEFSLHSISKPLSYGLALTDHGFDAVDAKVDVEPSGEAFHELSFGGAGGRPANAMINAGALAVASLLKGSGGRSAIRRIEEHYSLFAGRPLGSNGRVFRTELANSDRNHGLAYLLSSAGVIDGDPTRALETYLRQCAIQVTCRDLAMMAATLANGGTNPVTGAEALGLDAVERVLSVMMTSGMYDDAGDWVASVGMPAKSGVGGGIIAVLPGQAGLAVYSPPLDRHGNSVRGVATCRRISRDMEMHFVRSARAGQSAIRSSGTIDREPSTTRRTEEAAAALAEHGHRAAVVRLTGDLFFAGTESVVRELSGLPREVEWIIVDVRDVDEISRLATMMLAELRRGLAEQGRALVLVDPDGRLDPAFADGEVPRFATRDRAVAHCEDLLLERYGAAGARPDSVPVVASPALALLGDTDTRRIAALMERHSFADGDVVRRVGQRFGGVFFILSGAVGITAVDADGTRVRLSTLTAGMTFGDLALGDDDRQETTAKAEGRVEVMVLRADAIEDLERDDPALAVQLWRALARDAYFRMDLDARSEAARMRR